MQLEDALRLITQYREQLELEEVSETSAKRFRLRF
jgi:hypothetical protein